MKALWILPLLMSVAAFAQTSAPASKSPLAPASPKGDAHRNEDVARHRQMAKAHEEAARCLEAGSAEKQCHERLREACKGIAVGQYCGMRHAH
ncbi:MAG: hypothetical protein H0T67_02310 [Burkholderiaceae bacterium]|nr:hypothetical protein [Burkholderiaceae bacterium]